MVNNGRMNNTVGSGGRKGEQNNFGFLIHLSNGRKIRKNFFCTKYKGNESLFFIFPRLDSHKNDMPSVRKIPKKSRQFNPNKNPLPPKNIIGNQSKLH
jgi:hypothetical protein